MSWDAPDLIIVPPANGGGAARYAAEVMIQDFLGLRVAFEEWEEPSWRITRPGRPGQLDFVDTFFRPASKGWLSAVTLPREPLEELECGSVPFAFRNRNVPIPMLYRCPRRPPVAIEADRLKITFGFDLFASAFFMLSRYEEAVDARRDKHGRFTAAQSLALRGDFLQRPVVNEYLELLQGALLRLWPDLKPSPRSFAMSVSCDVDHLDRATVARGIAAARCSAASLIRRHDMVGAWKCISREIEAWHLSSSPYVDLHWIMSENERAGHAVVFYFLAGRTDPRFDGVYDICSTAVVSLLRRVHERGHEIGLHYSYGTLDDAEAVAAERLQLEAACADAGFAIQRPGGRAHFLRFNALRSPAALEAAGLAYDTTLGYADVVGFRCGVCYPFPAFDLVARRRLSLVERPLVAMEASLFREEYMGVGDRWSALDQLLSLKQTCRWAGGDFVLLWHNSNLGTYNEREIYRAVIA